MELLAFSPPDIEQGITALVVVGIGHLALLTYTLGSMRTLLTEHARRLDGHDKRLSKLESGS